MSPTEYWIFSGSQPVTNAMSDVLRDLETAKRLAQEVSEGQPGAIISVVSRSSEVPGAEWTATIAQFEDGKPYPHRWKVDFHGYLMEEDRARLHDAGVTYRGAHSEVHEGVLRSGLARHIVTVDADDADAAVAAVRDALGSKATECSEWNVEPAGPGS